ncbi:MAG: hypothetical protein PHV68_06575 [Candidatus Gastranaerophilales bacterium]|nr:hypothetical protein [Candidatus Gastranaerophilales bacterium]
MKQLDNNQFKIIAKAGNPDIAVVYIADINGKKIEFVESVQPPLFRDKKWVIIISSLYGCPVKCKFCDAGGFYKGKLSREDLLSQIDFLTKNRFGKLIPETERFKIQFARVGEPSLNLAVLDVLDILSSRYGKNVIPSISTVAPVGTDKFFEKLIEIKKKHYNKNFQLQFSIHNTDENIRNELIPVKKWDFQKISKYGQRFFTQDSKKITLNFALKDESQINPEILKEYFSPDLFLIKITPINPTISAIKNALSVPLNVKKLNEGIIKKLQDYGYDVILSIGELEENSIGSNCGQYISNIEQEISIYKESYNYELQSI